jgi:hypothetical protein
MLCNTKWRADGIDMVVMGQRENSRRGAAWTFVWAVSTLAANSFVIVVVNYWIYRARFDFIALHPEYVAEKPPTISRAISDPLIGEPFAFWIGLSAIVLAFGVISLGLLYIRSARVIGTINRRAAFIIIVTTFFGVASQLASSTGMIMLSRYTFFNNHDLHMIGSYMFFSGQTLLILIFGCLNLWMARRPEINGMLEGAHLLNPALTRIRAYWGPAVTAFAVVFLLLFFLKGFEFSFGNEELYLAYVLSEPAAISGYLSFLALYLIDLALIIQNAIRVWSADLQLSASGQRE